MRRALSQLLLLCGGALLAGTAAFAHESFMDCFDNGDGTVSCMAGYVDGSPPTPQDQILIKDADGTTLISGRFDDDGNFTFERPGDPDFMVIFMGAEIGHTHRIDAGALIPR